TSWPGGVAGALRAVMRERNTRPCRFRRSVSLSSAASSVRKRFTNAETEVSRSAALMRARRYVSSSTETVIFFIVSQYHSTHPRSMSESRRRKLGHERAQAVEEQLQSGDAEQDVAREIQPVRVDPVVQQLAGPD